MSQEARKSEAQAVEPVAPQVKSPQAGCCGGAAPSGVDACCALDAELKTTGGTGCGCSTAKVTGAPQKKGCC